jgi:hypothetical protein
VFAQGVPAVGRSGSTPAKYRPNVDVRGQTAYALLYQREDRRLSVRTVDGGRTWHQIPGDGVGVPQASYVAADGSHVVLTTSSGRVRFWVSRDGGRYEPATLPGYPTGGRDAALAPSHAGDIYVASAGNRFYLSGDGLTWRAVVPAR